MIFATTSTIQGREVEAYLGVVFGDTVLGVNVFKDFMAGIRDIVGGRSGTYEKELGAARDAAMGNLARQAESLGADAVIGIDIDYEVLGANNGMLMVSASGTAVRLKRA
ncbi:MAG: heavy metal-binding domain-containing protein [Acetobacteraceae bacterium]